MKLLKEIKNLFGKDDYFFDKEATIKEYFALVPPNKRKKVENYEELYEEALKYVEKQSFKENTKEQDNYFHEISQDEGILAVFLGILSYGVAREIDTNGTNVEKAIDKMLPKDYDVNNPFDVKKGYGHRIFGHDPVTFGLKNIPGNLNIDIKDIYTGKNYIVKISEFLGKDVNSKVSMWDLIWKFYGNNKKPLNGIVNCLSHTIIHFAKDIFTPAGLPLPFVSLFNEYTEYSRRDGTVLGIKYKDSLMQKLDKKKMNMKASDFASYFIINSFLKFYCYYSSKSKEISDVNGFLQDMKLISMGTCISLQMATIVMGKDLQVGKKGNGSMIPGGKVNILMTSDFFKTSIQDMTTIIKARREINKSYRSNYMEGYSNE